MNPRRIASMVFVFLCTASVAGSQMVWVPYQGNPILPPPEPGTWCDKGRWVDWMILVDGSVDVSSARADASFCCYGSVLDNTTSDPTTILPR